MQRREQAVPDLHTPGIEMSVIENVEKLLKCGFERMEYGDRVQGWRFVKEALSLDPGISPTYSPGANPIRANLQRILNEARLPLSFKWLATVCRQVGDEETSRMLLKRYLELAPDAADREQVIRYLQNQLQPVDRHSIGPVEWLNSALMRPWSWLRLRVRLRTRLGLR
jgi:hypothetical protein